MLSTRLPGVWRLSIFEQIGAGMFPLGPECGLGRARSPLPPPPPAQTGVGAGYFGRPVYWGRPCAIEEVRREGDRHSGLVNGAGAGGGAGERCWWWCWCWQGSGPIQVHSRARRKAQPAGVPCAGIAAAYFIRHKTIRSAHGEIHPARLTASSPPWPSSLRGSSRAAAGRSRVRSAAGSTPARSALSTRSAAVHRSPPPPPPLYRSAADGADPVRRPPHFLLSVTKAARDRHSAAQRSVAEMVRGGA